MEWILWVLLKIQSGHDCVNRRTNPPLNFVEARGIIIHSLSRITIFGSFVERFANDFPSWLRHSWILLANRLIHDMVIHGNRCIILYTHLNHLIKIHSKPVRLIAGVTPRANTDPLYSALHIISLKSFHIYAISLCLYKCTNGMLTELCANMSLTLMKFTHTTGVLLATTVIFHSIQLVGKT